MLPNDVIYTVTVLDDRNSDRPPYQRTPAIFTDFVDAVSAVRDNELDISEAGTNRYAIIEKTRLNRVLPQAEEQTWFEWNGVDEEYILIEAPAQFARVISFGIG